MTEGLLSLPVILVSSWRIFLHRLQAIAYALLLLGLLDWAVNPDLSRAQQTQVTSLPTLGSTGFMWMTPFTNPALVGALRMIPVFPYTGYYPLYPGLFSSELPGDGPRIGPLKTHLFLGIAEMYTDNVLRTTHKRSDFFTTFSPGIQAQLPFGSRHSFLVDYRTNLQVYQRTPSNNVADQTASGHLTFDLASGIKLDLQGEHKTGHDPRGTAFDTQAIDINKWKTNGVSGRLEYQGAQIGTELTVQSVWWQYLNNNQGSIRNRVSQYAGVKFIGHMLPNTSPVLAFGVTNDSYDFNKNLDRVTYTISAGARWDITGNMSGEFLAGYQFLQFTRAQVEQPPPVLSRFRRNSDSATSPFVAGYLYWTPIPRLQITLQPYRSIQPTVVFGTTFFTGTGVNLSAVRNITDRLDLRANIGFEQDKFSTPAGGVSVTPPRTDTLTNFVIGVNYRTVELFGVGLQYVYERRTSTVDLFEYQANTLMISLTGYL